MSVGVGVLVVPWWSDSGCAPSVRISSCDALFLLHHLSWGCLFDHLIEQVSVSLIHCKVTFFPHCNKKYFVRGALKSVRAPTSHQPATHWP